MVCDVYFWLIASFLFFLFFSEEKNHGEGTRAETEGSHLKSNTASSSRPASKFDPSYRDVQDRQMEKGVRNPSLVIVQYGQCFKKESTLQYSQCFKKENCITIQPVF